MTKFSVNINAHKKLILATIKEYNSQKEEKDHLDPKEYFANTYAHLDDKVVAVMCRYARMLAYHMHQFHSTLRNANLFKDCFITPVDGKVVAFMRAPTPGQVIVFPNLYFNTVDEDTTVQIEPIQKASVYNIFMLAKLIDEYKTGDPRGWNPIRRAIKRLTTRRVMSLESFITQYTTAKKNKMKDADIRDWCEDINDIFKPVEIKFADTPDDFMEMYGNSDGPNSCMTMHEKRSWQFMLDEWGVHPTAFYSYFPYTRGAYLKKGKKIVARTILWEFEPGVWEAGRMYFTNGAIAAKFMEGLKQNGIKVDGEGRSKSLTRPYKFEIPVFKGSQDSGIPIPYTDNLGLGAVFKLNDDKTKVIVESDSKNGSMNYMRAAGGYMPLSKLAGYVCSNPRCGVSFRTKGYPTHDSSNKIFCCEACYISCDYTYAKDSDGVQRLIPISTCIQVKDIYEGGWRYFTNEAAAIRNGAGRLGVYDEDLGVTVEDESGDIVIYNAKYSGAGFANGLTPKIKAGLIHFNFEGSILPTKFTKEVRIDRPLVDAPITCEDYLEDEIEKQLEMPVPKPPKKKSMGYTNNKFVFKIDTDEIPF